MKTTMSICVVILGFIAIPIQIIQILQDEDRLFYSILMVFSLPGFIFSLNFLYKKYNW